jgi:uncharacterized protein YbjT (DUF2867 family)
MQNRYKVAVLGGTGKSGQYLVRQLISLGYPVRLLLRNPANQQNLNPLIEMITGDARDSGAVQAVVTGCQAVISTLGQPKGELPIFSDASRNVIRAMDFFQIKRYIVTTGLNVDTPLDEKGNYAASATDWMKANYPKTTADKQVEWEILASSDLDWTLVRLPLIELSEQDTGIKISLVDCPGEKINAGSLAGFLVRQLEDKSYLKQSPFIANA